MKKTSMISALLVPAIIQTIDLPPEVTECFETHIHPVLWTAATAATRRCGESPRVLMRHQDRFAGRWWHRLRHPDW